MECRICRGTGKFPLPTTICPVCKGDGSLPDDRIHSRDCPVCEGKGWYPLPTRVCIKCGGWGKLGNSGAARKKRPDVKGLPLKGATARSTHRKLEANVGDRKGEIIASLRSDSKENWKAIESEFGVSKRDFGKKMNFISDSFRRNIIFRDVEHAFLLASSGFAKPAVILAGGVIEELLRLYLEHKKISPASNRFDDYIRTCESKKLLKSGIASLSDSLRHFRNLVHLSKEETRRHTISKATAKGAVSSIFTIANDFQKDPSK